VPFVTVNCAALAPTLLEAELFGAVRGAYTGAQTDRRGVFEAAHRGWLFLDEVACLTTTAQAALLRAVENQEIVRVGDTRPIKVNVRILSATNEDLGALVAAGRFRRDLWQRLCETTLILPPLSARRQEIPELIDHLARELPGGPFEVTPVAKRLLADLDWRDGNIRQLRNCLRAMTEHQTNGILCPQAIPASYLRPLPRSTLGALATTPTKWVDAAFTSAVTQLRATHGPLSVRQMALHLGMSKSAVARRLRSKPH
jgi:DNA-binding NtrC family response regulator